MPACTDMPTRPFFVPMKLTYREDPPEMLSTTADNSPRRISMEGNPSLRPRLNRQNDFPFISTSWLRFRRERRRKPRRGQTIRQLHINLAPIRVHVPGSACRIRSEVHSAKSTCICAAMEQDQIRSCHATGFLYKSPSRRSSLWTCRPPPPSALFLS